MSIIPNLSHMPLYGNTSPYPECLPNADLLSVTIALPILEFYINRVTDCAVFHVWHLLLKIMLLQFIHFET